MNRIGVVSVSATKLIVFSFAINTPLKAQSQTAVTEYVVPA